MFRRNQLFHSSGSKQIFSIPKTVYVYTQLNSEEIIKVYEHGSLQIHWITWYRYRDFSFLVQLLEAPSASWNSFYSLNKVTRLLWPHVFSLMKERYRKWPMLSWFPSKLWVEFLINYDNIRCAYIYILTHLRMFQKRRHITNQSRRPCNLKPRSVASVVMGLRFLIPLRHRCSYLVFAVISVRSDHWGELITRSEEPYQVCLCMCVCMSNSVWSRTLNNEEA